MHLTGTIETDGTLGALSSGNIVDFSFRRVFDTVDSIFGPTGSPIETVTIDTTGLTATANALVITGDFEFEVSVFASGTGGALAFGSEVSGNLTEIRTNSIFFSFGLFPGYPVPPTGFEATEAAPVDAVFATAAVVPLPAGAWLLLGGLGALVLGRRISA